jgi:hypothetical protein
MEVAWSSKFHVKRTRIAQNVARGEQKPIFVLFLSP